MNKWSEDDIFDELGSMIINSDHKQEIMQTRLVQVTNDYMEKNDRHEE